jgi:hypothetical protein
MGGVSDCNQPVGLSPAIKKVVCKRDLRTLFAGALAGDAVELRTFEVPTLLAGKSPRLA